MLLKIVALAKLLSALADSEAFEALIAFLSEWLKNREVLFGAAVTGNSSLQEFKSICLSKGVDTAKCDDLCGKLATVAAE